MPRYVRTITSWQLSRVERAIGASPWTHVFEQEFTDVEGLMGPYLMHPIHWAYVDRWFDPECPDVIVRDRVCHSFCECGRVGVELDSGGQNIRVGRRGRFQRRQHRGAIQAVHR